MSLQRAGFLCVVKLELVLICISKVRPCTVVDTCVDVHAEAAALAEAPEEIRKQKLVVRVHILIDDLDILTAFAAAQESKRNAGLARAHAVEITVQLLSFSGLLILHTEREIEQERIVLARHGGFSRIRALFSFRIALARLRYAHGTLHPTRNVLLEKLAYHRRLAGIACEENVHLPHSAPLERRCHRLEKVFHPAPNPILKRALELAHIDVDMHLRTVARVPGLFRGKERERRLEAVACRKLIIAGAALPERTQPLGEDLVVEM